MRLVGWGEVGDEGGEWGGEVAQASASHAWLSASIERDASSWASAMAESSVRSSLAEMGFTCSYKLYKFRAAVKKIVASSWLFLKILPHRVNNQHRETRNLYRLVDKERNLQATDKIRDDIWHFHVNMKYLLNIANIY
jgi:hypothetical protein